jgi:hypothetical protein
MPTGRCAVIMLATCLVLGACGNQLNSSLRGSEERVAIRLSVAESEHLRQGMQRYLASVQGIVEALPHNKRVAVSENAKNGGVGMLGMLSGVPASVVVRLPPEFLMLSMDTHQKFDALSRSAAAGESKSQMLMQLGDILANCTACHAKYKLTPN